MARKSRKRGHVGGNPRAQPPLPFPELTESGRREEKTQHAKKSNPNPWPPVTRPPSELGRPLAPSDLGYQSKPLPTALNLKRSASHPASWAGLLAPSDLCHQGKYQRLRSCAAEASPLHQRLPTALVPCSGLVPWSWQSGPLNWHPELAPLIGMVLIGTVNRHPQSAP